jgi:hypothetical protein
VKEIDSHDVREVVDTIFRDIFRLLECIGLIEAHLRQVDLADQKFTRLAGLSVESLIDAKMKLGK